MERQVQRVPLVRPVPRVNLVRRATRVTRVTRVTLVHRVQQDRRAPIAPEVGEVAQLLMCKSSQPTVPGTSPLVLRQFSCSSKVVVAAVAQVAVELLGQSVVGAAEVLGVSTSRCCTKEKKSLEP
jgi:hypothetical protein